MALFDMLLQSPSETFPFRYRDDKTETAHLRDGTEAEQQYCQPKAEACSRESDEEETDI